MKNKIREAPLPSTLEDAIVEILRLRSAWIRSNEILAKQVERRIQESRAMRGNIVAIKRERDNAIAQRDCYKDDNEVLKMEIEKLRGMEFLNPQRQP